MRECVGRGSRENEEEEVWKMRREESQEVRGWEVEEIIESDGG